MLGPETTHGIAAGRIDLRRAAAGEHARVGVSADHCDGLHVGGERQRAVVLEQHDAFLGVVFRDLGMGGKIDRRRAYRVVDGAFGDERARDAVHHVVEPRRADLSASDGAGELVEPLVLTEVRNAGLLVETVVGIENRVVLRAPIGQHVTLEAPIVLQHLIEQPLVLAGVNAVHQIVAAHDRAGIALLQGYLESKQVTHARGGFVDDDVDRAAARLLIIEGIVLERRDDVIRLNAAHERADHQSGQERIFAAIFEISAAAGLAQQIHAPCKHDVVARRARFATDHRAATLGQRRVPGRGREEPRRQQRALELGRRLALGRHATAGVRLPLRRDREPWHAADDSSGLRSRFGKAILVPLALNPEIASQKRELLVQSQRLDQAIGAFIGRKAALEPGRGSDRGARGCVSHDGSRARRRSRAGPAQQAQERGHSGAKTQSFRPKPAAVHHLARTLAAGRSDDKREPRLAQARLALGRRRLGALSRVERPSK